MEPEPQPQHPSQQQPQQPQELEAEHVHAVYDMIAEHFSATRYKPWPVVDNFLREMPLGSLGADVGCGNGKYLGVNPSLLMLGSDRSPKLIEIVRSRGFEGMVCDNQVLPYRDSCFDFAISIAVIHHFSTPERRKHAIVEMLRILRPGGRLLIFVWALEQQGKRKYETQDVFVPWHKPKRIYGNNNDPATAAPAHAREDDEEVVYQRYYHLFVAGELDALVDLDLARIVQSGYDRDNHFVILERK